MSYRTDMQSVVYNKVICDWRHVNKGTTQGRANGSYLLIFTFLNDLEINVGGETVCFKYADDCKIVVPVFTNNDSAPALINKLLEWS